MAGAMLRRAGPLAGLLAVLLGGIVLLTALGHGALAAPPLTTPRAWPAWAAGRDPAQVAFALLRLAALAVGWYLLGVTAVGAASRGLRFRRVTELADLLTVPPVRRLLQAAFGAGLATAALAAASGPVPDPAANPPAVAIAAGPASVPMRLESEGSPASMVLLPPGEVAAMRLTESHTEQVPTTWTVQPGEHFWAIAEQVLAAAWGRAPADEEVAPYWRRLVAANLGALADRDNPDLVYPGQVFTVPPPPGPPADR